MKGGGGRMNPGKDMVQSTGLDRRVMYIHSNCIAQHVSAGVGAVFASSYIGRKAIVKINKKGTSSLGSACS